jgi:hypothetical protein
MHDYSSLENFWKRFNKVFLDKLALDKEKMGLVQENQQLRTLLKQYLDGISVNDEIISQVNPLFIVNNKTNIKYVFDNEGGLPICFTRPGVEPTIYHTRG